MLIYETVATGKICCFIHIPKNAGKSVRKMIKNDRANRVIKEYWGIHSNTDLAHIPYIYLTTKTTRHKGKLVSEYLPDVSGNLVAPERIPEQIASMRFFAYIRNPYDRIISAYFYLNPGKTDATIAKFQKFILDVLSTYKFGTYSHKFIHYYPQYYFLCDAQGNLCDNIELVPMPKKSVPYQYSEFFTPECLEVINRVYARDFSLFGFSLLVLS